MNRFTISLDEQLARQFEMLVAQKRYASRSEAVRDLIRYGLGRAGLKGMQFDAAVSSCIANLSYVYDTRELALASRLQALRHAHHGLVIACHQTPLDHGSCMECVVLRGAVAAVHDVADELISMRGVRHGHANVVALMDDGGAARPSATAFTSATTRGGSRAFALHPAELTRRPETVRTSSVR